MRLEVRRRCLEILDIALELSFTAISNRTRADHRHDWSDCTSPHRFLKVLLVVFRKSRDFQRPALYTSLGPRFDAFQSLSDISEEAGFRLLAIGDDVYSGLNLLTHAFGYRAPNKGFIDGRIMLQASDLQFHQVEKIFRTWEAAYMCCQNAIGTLLDVHFYLAQVRPQLSDILM